MALVLVSKIDGSKSEGTLVQVGNALWAVNVKGKISFFSEADHDIHVMIGVPTEVEDEDIEEAAITPPLANITVPRGGEVLDVPVPVGDWYLTTTWLGIEEVLVGVILGVPGFSWVDVIELRPVAFYDVFDLTVNASDPLALVDEIPWAIPVVDNVPSPAPEAHKAEEDRWVGIPDDVRFNGECG